MLQLNGGVAVPAVSTVQKFVVTDPVLISTLSANSTSADHLTVEFEILVSHATASLAPAVDLVATTTISGFSVDNLFLVFIDFVGPRPWSDHASQLSQISVGRLCD